MPPAKHRHSVIRLRIYDAIRDYLRAHPLGSVYSEAGARLTRHEPGQTVLQPDVSYYTQRKNDSIEPDGYAGAPDLAVEVISPSDRPARLHCKIEYYREAAVYSVWIVFWESQEVKVFKQGTVVTLTGSSDDVLADPDLFPEWPGIRLQDLFSA